jgi:hypothetical protein
MLLVRFVLRWLMPAPTGMEPPAARIRMAPAAVETTAVQHTSGLVLIHAPLPRPSAPSLGPRAWRDS